MKLCSLVKIFMQRMRQDSYFWANSKGQGGTKYSCLYHAGREEGGGFRMGSTCIPVADSFWCLAKLIQCLRFKNKIKLKKKISQEAGQVVWYSHLFQNFPQFIVIHTVKDSGIVNKAIKFGFGKCSGALSCPNHWTSSLWLSYKTRFLSHVTIQLSNGSFLLCRIREDDTSNWGFFFIFLATHEASTYQAFLPFQFASDAKWHKMIDVKFLATSCLAYILGF